MVTEQSTTSLFTMMSTLTGLNGSRNWIHSSSENYLGCTAKPLTDYAWKRSTLGICCCRSTCCKQQGNIYVTNPVIGKTWPGRFKWARAEAQIEAHCILSPAALVPILLKINGYWALKGEILKIFWCVDPYRDFSKMPYRCLVRGM